MRCRMLGKTGLKVSELSFGCASLGQDYGGRKTPSRKDAIRLLRKAYDAGINFFDTASTYGESEGILGEALGDTDAIFCTKFKVDPTKVEESMGHSMTRSLLNLRRDRIDVMLAHRECDIRLKGCSETLDFWVEKERVGLRGVSSYVNSWSLTAEMDWAIQLVNNLLNPAQVNYPGEGYVFIARQPYARGLLCNPPWNIGEQALRFCLSNEHISTVLVGMQTEEELEQNLEWASLGPLPLEPK